MPVRPIRVRPDGRARQARNWALLALAALAMTIVVAVSNLAQRLRTPWMGLLDAQSVQGDALARLFGMTVAVAGAAALLALSVAFLEMILLRAAVETE
jgi:ABC-type Fe3+ transport system permease subunit